MNMCQNHALTGEKPPLASQEGVTQFSVGDALRKLYP